MPLQNCTKIAIGWLIATGVGVYAFILAREDIDKKRYERMKEKQRLRNNIHDN